MKYFIIAGEASGDLHASNLMRSLKNNDPEAVFCFLGGDKMLAQGGNMIKHYRDMAFMGIINVIMNLGKVLRNIKDCKAAIVEFKPDIVILIDYPSFNLRIAKWLKNTPQFTSTPVYYYISPKIWAWKEWRIKSIKKYIDKIYSIIPFEVDYYHSHNMEVTYVGNPCVDSVDARDRKDETDEQFKERNSLNNKPIIAILSGSRKQEINGCLATMLSVKSDFKDYQFVVAAAPSMPKEVYTTIMQHNNINDVGIVSGETYQLLQHSHAAIVNSGTATLETALMRVPQVVVYNVFGGRLVNIIKPIILKVKFVSLVNLIAGKEVVKELIAADFTHENVSSELNKIINNGNDRTKMLKEYDSIIRLLGKPGVADKTAAAILTDINKPNNN